MYKLVYTVFKTIFLSMMLIFVFDIGFYLIRAFSINQRMESIMTSMQKVVMENNYLPQGDYDMYKTIFEQLMADMNGDGTMQDRFIVGIGINYKTDPKGTVLTQLIAQDSTGHNRNILKTRMEKPAEYGEVMICQTRVGIQQPIWGFDNSEAQGYHYSGEDSTKWGRIGYRYTTFYYTYYVPCLKYQSVQDV